MTVGLIFPILIDEFLLDAGLCLSEVCSEELPSRVEHLVDLDVDVDCKDSCSISSCILQTSVVIVTEVETVLELGLCVLDE